MAQRGAKRSSITPTGRGRDVGQRRKEGNVEESKRQQNKECISDHKHADLLSKMNTFNVQSFFFPYLFAPRSFVYRCRRPEIRREERFSAEQRSPGVEEKNSDESVYALSQFSSEELVCWSPWCLSYWPVGERETEQLCWIEGNHMYFIWERKLSSMHLFLEQPDASPFSEDRSLLSVTNF